MSDTEFTETGANTLSVGLHKTAKAHGAAHVVIEPELLTPIQRLRDLHNIILAQDKAEVIRSCDAGDSMLITSTKGLSVTSSDINR